MDRRKHAEAAALHSTDASWVTFEGLSGRGRIAGTEVRCLSAATQMLCHTGYRIGEKDIREMALLHEGFGVAYPAEHAHLAP